jgi:hypothetical protein
MPLEICLLSGGIGEPFSGHPAVYLLGMAGALAADDASGSDDFNEKGVRFAMTRSLPSA